MIPSFNDHLPVREVTVTSDRPVLVIVDGAVDVTGSLVSAASQAATMADVLSTVLVLPANHRVPADQLTAFDHVATLPIVPLRRSVASMLAYLPALLMSSAGLRRLLAQHASRHVQLNDFYLAQGPILRLLGFRGKIVTYVRIDPTRFGLAGKIWLRAAAKSADELVVVSRFIQLLVDPIASRLIYNVAKRERVTPRDRPAGKVLLFVGNYIVGKGQDDAIRAFHRIAARFADAEILFHGGDMGLAKNREYRADLLRLAESGPGRQRIHLCGFSDEPQSLYSKAYAAINFSHSESFSLTCLEASAHGLAVVATSCGGPEEIIEDGVTGFLVPVGDVEAMAKRMADLLRDPARAAKMGEAGRRLVEKRFSVANFRKQMLEIFDLD
jgi:glycosyltransferase involved in cell wall biosynthesis